MDALISCGSFAFPEPSSYSALTYTIVDSARNANGKLVGSVIRSDVAKIEVSWRMLTVEQWSSILSLFNRNFYNNIRFFNQSSGMYETRTMYVSDRKSGMWRRHPETGAVMGWLDCSLSLIEV